ncbi:MAG: type VI secretion system-associated protein TagF [Deltaproteobacteria bacterium]|nr:type VI secretion system-associated protein TagF [Deltaproteobacteria bacterium]
MVNPRMGVFGKLPSAGDFVSHNAAQASARALQEWMVTEVEHLAAKRKHLPAAPVKFLVRDPAGTSACIGAFAPGRDRVGREFPLASFVYVDLPVATVRFPSLPVAYASFLETAARMVASAAELTLDLPGVLIRGDTLVLPGPQELEDARTWTHQALDATPGQTILDALFGPAADGVAFHGVHMFMSACAHVHGMDPGRASIVLDCPCTDDVQLIFWLRLADTLLQWRRAPPSLFWIGPDGPNSRLLICLGAPAPGVLHFLSDPSVAAEKLWPMRTTHASAIEAGRRGLSPNVTRALTLPPPAASGLLNMLAAG